MSTSSPKLSSANQQIKGMLLILTATFLFSCQDAVSKHLSEIYPVVVVVWARYMIHTVLMVAISLPKSGLGGLRTRNLKLQTWRGIILISTSLFFTSSLQYMPLAEATAIQFIAPLIVTVLSAPVLQERATAGQYIAAATGFIGTLFIVHPGGDFFTPTTILPFCSATCFAFYQLLTRKLSAVDSPTTSNFFGGLFSTIVMSALLPFFWVTPTLADCWLMLALGTLGMTSHLLFSQAFHYAPPAMLAPFSYCQIIFAGLLGFVLFRHIPDATSIFGVVIVCLSGLFAIFQRREKSVDINSSQYSLGKHEE